MEPCRYVLRRARTSRGSAGNPQSIANLLTGIQYTRPLGRAYHSKNESSYVILLTRRPSVPVRQSILGQEALVSPYSNVPPHVRGKCNEPVLLSNRLPRYPYGVIKAMRLKVDDAIVCMLILLN
jgi:hypothetical protein